MAERWLTFRATLVLAVSGGPDLDFPQHDADTLAPLADFAADFNILGFLSICRQIAASPDADCNCSLKRSRCQVLGYILPAVKDVASDLPLPRVADSCWRICPVLGHDDKVVNSSVPQIDLETLSTAPAACSLHAQFFEAH